MAMKKYDFRFDDYFHNKIKKKTNNFNQKQNTNFHQVTLEEGSDNEEEEDDEGCDESDDEAGSSDVRGTQQNTGM